MLNQEILDMIIDHLAGHDEGLNVKLIANQLNINYFDVMEAIEHLEEEGQIEYAGNNAYALAQY